MTQGIRFDAIELPEETRALRREVRAFLDEERRSGALANEAEEWGGYSREFSLRLAKQGWIGITWPKKYGGHEGTALQRYVVNEELLVARAPLASHFVADRQSGPLLLRFGTEEQRERFLPPITRGELSFSIGMSEPNAGSDLASVQTNARHTDGGWLVSGTKLWTSWAHRADYMITLVRTSPLEGDKHAGLSQFVIDMSSDNILVRPIYSMSGSHTFNEVVFDECFVPDESMVGEEGNGWDQVTSELGYERSGPERFLSLFRMYLALVDAIGPEPNDWEAAALGRLAAHIMTLRSMSISVAGMLQQGLMPKVEASLVKDLGTCFEQELPEIARRVLLSRPEAKRSEAFRQVLADSVLHARAITIQGGSKEILRIVIARGIGLR